MAGKSLWILKINNYGIKNYSDSFIRKIIKNDYSNYFCCHILEQGQ